MKIIEIIKFVENWAPAGCAWEKDNTGLQVGAPGRDLENVFLCLELTESALREAVKKKCNFILTHHPLIFSPIKKLDFQNNPKSQLIEKLIKQNITLYAAHTNLDFTVGGVSFILAKALKLKNISFLENQVNNQFKIVVYIPETYLNDFSDALFEEGAGVIGNYKKCSFRTSGNGTFEGNKTSIPAIGKPMKFEVVPEIRLEILTDSWNLKKIISTILKNHPYEQPAYDIYPLNNVNENFGSGAIGDLPDDLLYDAFLDYVSENLNISNFRYCRGRTEKVKRVALCGGSGSDLLNTAISKNADAFITADIKYHTFQEAEDKILMIDAGHYETEIFALSEIKNKIDLFIKQKESNCSVYTFTETTNPVKYYKN